MAHGPKSDGFFKSGHTFWRYGGEDGSPTAKLRLPHYFAYNTLRSGKRKKGDQVPLTNSFGEPLPQILVLVALRTKKFSDWAQAIQSWDSVCSDLLEGPGRSAAAGLEFLKERVDVFLAEPPPPLADPEDQAENPSRFENWAAQWMLTMVKAEAIDYLRAWDRAALRALKRLTLVGENFSFVDQLTDVENREVSEMARVLRAIKRATLVCGGVPHQGRVASILANDGGPELTSDRVRNLRKTLGFGWLPRKSDWKKQWAPIADAMDWI